MTARDDGGPAFPHPGLGDPRFKPQPGDFGMSLRDYFAGQALASLAGSAASDGSDFLHSSGAQSAARWAYAFADAMLAARSAK